MAHVPGGEDRERVLADFDVSRETMERLDAMLATLDDWRGRINLIGPKEWPNVWGRHIADSLQLLEHVPAGADVIDFGSGAGFPGLVIAAGIDERGRVELVESVGKKCAFLRAAAEAAGLGVRVTQGRVESLAPRRVDVVTARALAPLPRLLELAAPWLGEGRFALLPKGRTWQEELTAAKQKWTFTYEAIVSRTHSEGAILKISEVDRHD